MIRKTAGLPFVLGGLIHPTETCLVSNRFPNDNGHGRYHCYDCSCRLYAVVSIVIVGIVVIIIVLMIITSSILIAIVIIDILCKCAIITHIGGFSFVLGGLIHPLRCASVSNVFPVEEEAHEEMGFPCSLFIPHLVKERTWEPQVFMCFFFDPLYHSSQRQSFAWNPISSKKAANSTGDEP